jgi:ABC-type uncharacterized transport system permease subunit
MNGLTTLEFLGGAACYAAATALYSVYLYRREESATVARWAHRLLGAGAALQLMHVVSATLILRMCPVFSVHFALSLFSVAVSVAYLALAHYGRLRALGLVIAPFGLTFLVAAQFVSVTEPLVSQRGLLAVHVVANLGGVSAFFLAGAVSALYVIHERRLKARQLGWLTARLPPLDRLDRVGYRSLLVGFPLLSVGIVTGAAFSARLDPNNGAEVLRAALSYATWLVAVAVLVLRVVAGWRGRRAALGSIAGAILLLLVLLVYMARPTLGGAS